MASVTSPLPSAAPPVPSWDSDVLYEIVNGERREIPHMGAISGTIASFLLHYMNAFAIPKRLGFAVVEVLFQLRPDRPQRRPDLAFLSYERWRPPSFPLEDPPAFEVVPNLAVEVVSPTNAALEIEDKIHNYFEAGVELVWVIHPRHCRIYVHEPENRVHVRGEKDELDGGKVLPGFRLKIADLFALLVKPIG
jgi:Uma2 family endonuclease